MDSVPKILNCIMCNLKITKLLSHLHYYLGYEILLCFYLDWYEIKDICRNIKYFKKYWLNIF